MTIKKESEDHCFSKRVILVKLIRQKDEGIFSRSQARRLLTSFDGVKNVVLDFEDVSIIGQAFADEIFRVYANAHSDIKIDHTNANEDIKNMIKHVLQD